MKGFWSRIKDAIVNAPSTTEVTQEQADTDQQQVSLIKEGEITERQEPKAVSGVMTLTAQAEATAPGSATRSFLPVFLRTFFDDDQDLDFTLTRGSELMPLPNLSVDMLADHSKAGWAITVELDPHDVASSIILCLPKTKASTLEFVLYPTVTVDLGTGDLAFVYRLDTVIDRAVSPAEFRQRTMLEELMAENMGAAVQSYNCIPLPGFKLPRGQSPVRVLRYGKRYSLEEMTQAFDVHGQIDKAIKAQKAHGEIEASPAEQIFNAAFIEMFEQDFSNQGAEAVIITMARKLVSGGMSLEDRLIFAPEMIARLEAFVPEWVKANKLTEKDVATMFEDPENPNIVVQNHQTRNQTTA